MAKRTNNSQPQSKILTADDLRLAIKNVIRRLDDLGAVDISEIEDK